MGFIKNLSKLDAQINALIVKVEAASLDNFRAAVWAVFCEIVDTTPQFRGRAAANWNIGLGAPDFSVDTGAGDRVELKTSKKDTLYTPYQARRAGDKVWTDFAKDQNKYKIRLIQRNTRVYISNGIRGDTDGGKSSESYLYDLQSPTYWASKLRTENQPYETVAQVIAMESWRLRLKESIVGEKFFA